MNDEIGKFITELAKKGLISIFTAGLSYSVQVNLMSIRKAKMKKKAEKEAQRMTEE